MGMELIIAHSGPVDWKAARDLLAEKGILLQMRMIDGELALSDDAPPETWRELRLGTPQGMITVRREPGRLALVTWGNADAPMRQAWHALTWAFATATGGQVQTEHGALTADQFRGRVELPAGFGPG